MHAGGAGVGLRLLAGELHHLRGGETLDGGRAGALAERAAEASIKRGDLFSSRRIHPDGTVPPREPAMLVKAHRGVLLRAPADGGNLAHRNARIPKPLQYNLQSTNPHFGIRPSNSRVGVRQETIRRAKLRQVATVVYACRRSDLARICIIYDRFCALRRQIYPNGDHSAYFTIFTARNRRRKYIEFRNL